MLKTHNTLTNDTSTTPMSNALYELHAYPYIGNIIWGDDMPLLNSREEQRGKVVTQQFNFDALTSLETKIRSC